MTVMSITVGGVVITDVAEQRDELQAVRAQLTAIYDRFDPGRPERLLSREAEIVALLNRAEILREIVENWDQAETARATILAGWEMVQAFVEREA
jgi:hypothetical protein